MPPHQHTFCVLVIPCLLWHQSIFNQFLVALLVPFRVARSFLSAPPFHPSCCGEQFSGAFEQTLIRPFGPLPHLSFLNKENAAFYYQKKKKMLETILSFRSTGQISGRAFFYLRGTLISLSRSSVPGKGSISLSWSAEQIFFSSLNNAISSWMPLAVWKPTARVIGQLVLGPFQVLAFPAGSGPCWWWGSPVSVTERRLSLVSGLPTGSPCQWRRCLVTLILVPQKPS